MKVLGGAERTPDFPFSWDSWDHRLEFPDVFVAAVVVVAPASVVVVAPLGVAVVLVALVACGTPAMSSSGWIIAQHCKIHK